jgi:hypothetical protein
MLRHQPIICVHIFVRARIVTNRHVRNGIDRYKRYTSSRSMAKTKRRDAEGKQKKINRKSPNQKQIRRLKDLQRLQNFNNKKAEEKQSQDMMARQAALEKLGITQNFDFEDHKALYNYAQEHAPINQAPIEIIDATVDPPEVTSYPEYPIREFSSPPAFDIAALDVAKKSTKETVLNSGASRVAGRWSRAKAILQMHSKK